MSRLKRNYSLRHSLTKRHRVVGGELEGLTGSALTQALDKLEKELRDTPAKWSVRFGANKQRRSAFLLYRACIKLEIDRLRDLRDYDSARVLDAYHKTLVDMAPRDTEFFNHEWKLISQALRPQGSNPISRGAKRAYSVYQWLLKNKTVCEGRWL